MPLLVPDQVYADMLAMLRAWRAGGSPARRGGWTPHDRPTPTAAPAIVLEISGSTSEVANQRFLYTAKLVDEKLTASKYFTAVGEGTVNLRNLFEWRSKGAYTDTSITGLKPLPAGLQVLATLRTDSDGTSCYVCSFPNEPLINC